MLLFVILQFFVIAKILNYNQSKFRHLPSIRDLPYKVGLVLVYIKFDNLSTYCLYYYFFHNHLLQIVTTDLQPHL